jgi:short-subunit dehydrogenase
MVDFGGKIAIVTGASSGIGLAVSRALCEQGARVVLVSRTAAKLDAAVAGLEARGFQVEGMAADVSKRDAIEQVVAHTVKTYGRVDYMLNNAGVSVFGEARDLLPGDWEAVVDVNLWGTVHGTNAVYPVMIRQGFGHIVNVASLAGLVPTPAVVAYSATKHAIVGLSEALRYEAARYGVRVSVVCPAAVQTPIVDTTPYRSLDKQKLLASVPGQPAGVDSFVADMLKGVRQNQAIIAPGFAGVAWRLHRYLPSLSRVLMRKLSKMTANNRDAFLLTVEPAPARGSAAAQGPSSLPALHAVISAQSAKPAAVTAAGAELRSSKLPTTTSSV